MDAVQEGERTPVQSKRRRLAHHRHRAQSIIQFQSLDQLEDEVTHGYYETTPTRQGSRKRVILIEILNGLLWWICFGQLSCLLHSNSPLSLWQQFSLIVLILIFTVSFTCLSILKRACLSHFGLLFLRVSSILILVSDWFYLPLVGGVIGGVACFLSLMSGLWNLSILDKYRKIHFHLLALILLQIMSFWFPAFSRSFFLSFYIGPSLGLVITCITFTQDHRTPLVSSDKLSGRRDSRKSSLVCANRSEWAWLGAGFGCHLFIAWAVYGLSGMASEWEDGSSTLSTQVLRVLVIAAFCGGVLLGNESNLPLICSYQWLTMGGIGYLLFVYCNSSTAALGLLLVSLHIMSLLPQLYSRLTEYTPSNVLPVAIVTYLCLLLISRVDVGGVKLSTFVVLVSVIFQWCGLRKWLPLGVELGIVKDNSLPVSNDAKKRRPSYTMMVGRMIRRLSTVQEQEEEIEEEEEEEEERENGGVAMSSIHRRRLLELLIEQEAEMRHFEVKKLRQVILCLIVLAVLCAASV